MNYERSQINKELESRLTYSKTFSIILFLAFFSFIFLYIRIDNPLPYYCLIFGSILVLGIASTQKLYIKINGLQKWWIGFIIYTLLVTICTDGVLSLGKEGSAKSLILLFLIFIIILYFTQFSSRIYFFKVIRNFMALCSILGIIEYVTKFQFYQGFISVDAVARTYQIYGIPGTPDYRLILFFAHPIYFSVFLTVFLIILMYIPFNKKIVNIFFEFIGLICLILTQSRSSWISFMIILILYLLASNKIKKINLRYIKEIFISIILMAMLIYILGYISPAFFQNLSKAFIDRINALLISPETASGARLANLSLLNYISNSLIIIFGGGNGYALGLLKAHPTVNGWNSAVDNQYLTFFIDYGILGLFIFLCFCIKCFKILFVSKDKIDKMIILSILSILITGYFFEFYQNMYVNYFLFILIAFVRENNTENSGEYK